MTPLPQTAVRDELLSIWTILGLGLILALASAAFVTSPLMGLLVLCALICLFVGVKHPHWMLFLFAATLILGEMSIGPETAVSSATALIFMTVTAGYIVLAKPTLQTRSNVPALLIFWSVCLMANAIMKLDWTLLHPRGAITLWMLALTALSVAEVLRNGQWIWQLATVLALSNAFVALLTFYEGVSGNFNPFGFFDAASEDRAFGLSDANYTAALLVTFMPFVLMHVLAGKSKFWRVAAMCLIGMNLAAIASTASRGGVVGVLVMGVAMSLWATAPTSDPARRSAALRARAAVIVFLVVCGIIALAMAPPVFFDRVITLQDWSHPGDVKESRVGLWADYLQVCLQSPIWGHGPGWLDPVLIGNSTQFPHNTLLQVAVEIGLFGLIPYVAINIWAFLEALRARRLFAQQNNDKLSILSGAVALSLIGFQTTGFFLSSAGHKELWVLIGMAAALHHLATSPERYRTAR